jgi:hypothetical protein
LLYVSPVVPDRQGTGLAIRSALVLEQLAAHYDVSLLAVALHGPVQACVAPEISRICARVHLASPQSPPSLASLAPEVRLVLVIDACRSSAGCRSWRHTCTG